MDEFGDDSPTRDDEFRDTSAEPTGECITVSHVVSVATPRTVKLHEGCRLCCGLRFCLSIVESSSLTNSSSQRLTNKISNRKTSDIPYEASRGMCANLKHRLQQLLLSHAGHGAALFSLS